MSINNPEAPSSDISPLALDAWNSAGENSYFRVLETVEDEVKHIEDDLLRYFVESALYAKIAHDARANADNLSRYRVDRSSMDSDSLDEQMLAGLGTPAEHALFLAKNSGLKSMEIARKTHVGKWNTREEIDGRVRSSLDTTEELMTERDKDDQRYRIRQFGTYDKHPLVFVDRKRHVRSHLGGRMITIAKSSLLLNGKDPSIRENGHAELYDYLVEQHEAHASQDTSYDYNVNSHVINKHLEPVLRGQNPDEGVSYAIPIGTTYYAKIVSAEDQAQ